MWPSKLEAIVQLNAQALNTVYWQNGKQDFGSTMELLAGIDCHAMLSNFSCRSADFPNRYIIPKKLMSAISYGKARELQDL